jgi:hypothetical protein
MALQSKTVTYTPFNKTSWGFASGDLSGTHSGLTNVKVVITPQTSTHWDATGHISTAGSGSAVASYNKQKFEWTCSGPLADVDAVLDALDFFPADYPAIRSYDATTNPTGWTTTALKTNATNGTYANENPADTVAIPDTDFDLKVYDLSDGSLDGTYVIKFDPTQPTFGKQRPYWSTAPTNEDANTSAHDEIAGGLLDLGEISQLIPGTSVSDTDPLTVTCQFRPYGSTSIYTGSAYGQFTPATNTFIGDKKPGTTNTSDKRINFTGTKEEVQAYLDNVRYYNNGNELAFDMFFTLSNGVVGSTLTKGIWFSDAVIGATTIPSQPYTEDTAADFDFNITTSNVSPDSNTFTATVTLAAPTNGTLATSSSFNASQYGSAFTESFNSSTGVLTITHTSTTDTILLLALSNLVFTPEEDFKDNFNMTVDLTYTGSVNSSSYTTPQQTVAVSGTLSNEVDNQNTTHTWTEDTVYEFSGATLNPRIIHPVNSTFDFTLTLSDAAAGSLSVPSPSSTYGTMTAGGSGVYTLTGTKTQVNAGLAAMQFIPVTDYATSFNIGFLAERTSGDLTYQEDEYGTYTMTATAVGEYSITQPAAIDWFEDSFTDFDSGLAITDTAADNSQLPASGSTYTVECEMFYYTGSAWADYTAATLTTNTTGSLTITGTGQTPSDKLIMTGTKSDVNAALADMKFAPNCGETVSVSVYYKLIRNYDSVVFTDQSESTKTLFNEADGADYSYTNLGLNSWNEDTPKDFDCGVRIVDGASDNSGCALFGTDYTATIQAYYWDGSADQDLTTATWSTTSSGSATVTGNGKSGTPLVIDGTKADVNTALTNLRMTPDLDWTDSPAGNDAFYIYVDLLRNDDSLVILDGSNFSTYVYASFNPGTESLDYEYSVTGMTYTEDVNAQSIFSGKTIGITDVAAENYPNITYEVTLKLSEDGSTSSALPGVWTGTSSHEITLTTDTKTNVNAAIQALQFTPSADYNTDVHILYTQKRYVSGVLDTTHADDIDIGTVTGTDVGEFTYGTANSNIQYYVADQFLSGVDTTDTVSNILDGTANVTLTPKQITLNKSLTYERPITVTDAYEDGGTSEYKIVFSGGTLLALSGVSLNTTDTGWQTKADLHTILDNGIYVTGFNDTNNNYVVHGTTYTANFTLHRKTYTGTETQIANGQLTYNFQTGLKLFKEEGPYTLGNYANNRQYRIDNTANGGSVTLELDYTPASPETSPDKLIFKTLMSADTVTTQSGVTTGAWLNEIATVETYPNITARVMNVTANPDEWSDIKSYFATAGNTASIDGTHWWSVHDNSAHYIIHQRDRNSNTERLLGNLTGTELGEILAPVNYTTAGTFTDQIAVKAWTPWGVVLTSGAPIQGSLAYTINIDG